VDYLAFVAIPMHKLIRPFWRRHGREV